MHVAAGGPVVSLRFSGSQLERAHIMTAALTVQQYLEAQGIAYDVLPHTPTTSSLHTAEIAHISADKLAKAVILKRDAGYLLVVVPASHNLQWMALRNCLNQNLALATEEEIAWLLPDCAAGAVPPIGEAYGIETVVDESVVKQPDIFFEGGDHATLVHMSGRAFCAAMAHAKHGRFSRQCLPTTSP
jgi:Ala-tRNA(Pro) deacylase